MPIQTGLIRIQETLPLKDDSIITMEIEVGIILTKITGRLVRIISNLQEEIITHNIKEAMETPVPAMVLITDQAVILRGILIPMEDLNLIPVHQIIIHLLHHLHTCQVHQVVDHPEEAVVVLAVDTLLQVEVLVVDTHPQEEVAAGIPAVVADKKIFY